MTDIYIQKTSGIEAISGYKLPNGLAAHKNPLDDATWVIIDFNSGLYLKKNLKTLTDCQIYSRHFPDKEKVEELRKSDRYKRYVNKLKEWKKVNLDY